MIQQRELKILGLAIKIKCTDKEYEHIEKLSFKLTQKVDDLRTKSKVVNLDILLCMVAINLLDELHDEDHDNLIEYHPSETFIEKFTGTINSLDNFL